MCEPQFLHASAPIDASRTLPRVADSSGCPDPGRFTECEDEGYELIDIGQIMSADAHNADKIRCWPINDIDPAKATVHYATEGMVATTDLWWLYEKHRIMAPE